MAFSLRDRFDAGGRYGHGDRADQPGFAAQSRVLRGGLSADTCPSCDRIPRNRPALGGNDCERGLFVLCPWTALDSASVSGAAETRPRTDAGYTFHPQRISFAVGCSGVCAGFALASDGALEQVEQGACVGVCVLRGGGCGGVALRRFPAVPAGAESDLRECIPVVFPGPDELRCVVSIPARG